MKTKIQEKKILAPGTQAWMPVQNQAKNETTSQKEQLFVERTTYEPANYNKNSHFSALYSYQPDSSNRVHFPTCET